MTSTGATVINARLRASAGGTDQSMANGGGTAPTSGTALAHNLGNVVTISHRDYAFSLEHRVGQGFLFRLVDTQSTPETWLLAYGSGFAPALPGTLDPDVTVATQTTLGGVAPAGLAEFNSLRLEVQATQVDRAPPAEEVRVSGMYFSSPTLSLQDGSFDNVVVTPTTPGRAFGEVVGGVAPTVADGFAFQRLVADEPLTAHDWTLGGQVHLQRSGGGDGEAVRFVIQGQQVSAVFAVVGPVPEPATAGLLAMAGLMLVRRRRTPTGA